MEIKRSKYESRGGVLSKTSGRRGLLLSVILFLFVVFSVEAQCSMCRAVLETEADGKAAEGINNGILYLMAIPYVIVGTIFFFVYRKLKK